MVKSRLVRLAEVAKGYTREADNNGGEGRVMASAASGVLTLTWGLPSGIERVVTVQRKGEAWYSMNVSKSGQNNKIKMWEPSCSQSEKGDDVFDAVIKLLLEDGYQSPPSRCFEESKDLWRPPF